MNKKRLIRFIVGTWVVAGIVFAAFSFAYKVYEIVMTVPNGEVIGFAAVHIATYLFVAIGFFLLFIWSFLRGDFREIEEQKMRPIEMERRMAELERRGAHGG